MLEKKCLFGVYTRENYFLCEDYIDVNRSPFVKYCIRNIVFGESFENLMEIIAKEKISYDNFKVKYLDIEGNVEFGRRHELEGIIGYEIIGNAKVNSPDVIVGVTFLNGKWIMGEYLKNKAIWYEHINRPQEYCNALTTRVSRAIVNITVGNNINSKIIDPCCGIGTVVMEALSMGLDIKGSDINEKVARGAMRNLEYFNYPNVIDVGSIHDIKEHYDIAIIDLPYGILSITNKLMQLDIIRSAKSIAKRLAVVGVENIEDELFEMELNIIEKCIISKGKFKRKLYICE